METKDVILDLRIKKGLYNGETIPIKSPNTTKKLYNNKITITVRIWGIICLIIGIILIVKS